MFLSKAERTIHQDGKGGRIECVDFYNPIKGIRPRRDWTKTAATLRIGEDSGTVFVFRHFRMNREDTIVALANIYRSYIKSGHVLAWRLDQGWVEPEPADFRFPDGTPDCARFPDIIMWL